MPDPTKDFNIKRMLLTYQRNAPAPKRAAPLSLALVTSCLLQLHHLKLNAYDSKLLKALILTCYYGCLRIGELCLSNNLDNVLKNTCAEFFTRNSETYFKVTLLKFKHSK